jgi:hypothetical protein
MSLVTTTLVFHLHIWEITYISTQDNVLQIHTVTEAKKLAALQAAAAAAASSTTTTPIAAVSAPGIADREASTPLPLAEIPLSSPISLPISPIGGIAISEADNRPRTMNLPSRLLIECRDVQQARHTMSLLQAYLKHAPSLFVV